MQIQKFLKICLSERSESLTTVLIKTKMLSCSRKKPFKQDAEASIQKKISIFKFKILEEHFRENQPPLQCSLTSP